MPSNKTVFLPDDPDTALALITEPDRLRRWKADGHPFLADGDGKFTLEIFEVGEM